MRDFHLPGRSPVYASNGMVATSHPLAAAEALAVLKDGGNAIDAAIAGAVLLGVCEPPMTGIGGDCFALVKPAGENRVVALNGSGRAPKRSDAQALRDEGLTRIEPGHPASVTIPGAVDGLCRLSERFGRLGLDRSFAPAIRYFDEGVPISPRSAYDVAPVFEVLTEDARRHFTRDNRPYRVGETFAMPGQAEVLRRILRDGSKAFYEGEVAEDILTALKAAGGVHEPEDFTSTEATWGEPVSAIYKRFEIFEHRPNGQGATALLLLNILGHFDLASMDPNGAERIHIEAEAQKLAYDARNRFIADPDHANRLDHMLALETASALAAMIDPNVAMAAAAPLTEAFHQDTILITAADRDGMAVSLIYSLFAAFGSGIASPKFGIMLQNRGSGFNLIPGHPNEVGPGKRPMHTIIPAMRGRDGVIDMTFGVMGGHYQPAGHARVQTGLIDLGLDPQAALDAPRFLSDPISGDLQIENGVDAKVAVQLADLGHKVAAAPKPLGGGQIIMLDEDQGVLIGASDPRKDGIAIGY